MQKWSCFTSAIDPHASSPLASGGEEYMCIVYSLQSKIILEQMQVERGTYGFAYEPAKLAINIERSSGALTNINRLGATQVTGVK